MVVRGVLLSTVLIFNGISVPLWSVAKNTKMGIGLEGGCKGFSGMAYSILGFFLTDD